MRHPNIIMITCHDIGRHIGCYGVETAHTPNLDRLASEGLKFTNFYSTSAVCSPARGSLHTGRYPQSNGLMGLTHAPWWWKLKDGEKHTAAILKDAGYDPYLIGFNHVDPDPERLGYNQHLSASRDPHETVRETCGLIKRAGSMDAPFFAKVGFTEVHRPFTHGKETGKGVYIPPWLQDTQDMRDDFAEFQGTIRFFDQRVGEIMEALERSDVYENTLLVMTSDHGIPYPGAKWTVRKAGIEVPLIIRQPGTIFSGGEIADQLMSGVDLLPTLLEYAGVDIPPVIQGKSFMGVLQGDKAGPVRKAAFSQYTPEMKRDNTSRSVITERYHLIRYFDAGRTVEYPAAVHPQTFADHRERCKTGTTRPFFQLFDLQADPYELTDIGQDPSTADIAADLSAMLLAWMKDVDDPLLKGPVRTPYYERTMGDLLRYE
ncbi:MAG: sulfatase [Spirochaetia bacterium]